LTDGQGRTVDFRNAVLIMTSNIRSTEALTEYFRPEFLNRIDEIVEFKALSRKQIADIVELQLGRLRERLAERGLALELTDAAKETIADAGWDPAYGAMHRTATWCSSASRLQSRSDVRVTSLRRRP
jgi:ATP-dependent Clp protease ATP-binding subunit ClpB